MKPIIWILIIGFLVSLPVGITILLIVLLKGSWYWIILPIVLIIVGGLTAGGIILAIKLSKRSKLEEKVKPSDAEASAIYQMVYDNDDPDNFIREDREIANVGEKGGEMTKILWLKGRGSETRVRRDILINLMNPNIYPLFLKEKEDKDVREVIKNFAENPEKVIVEERTPVTDEYGRTSVSVKTTKMSQTEKKEKEENEEAEKSQAM